MPATTSRARRPPRSRPGSGRAAPSSDSVGLSPVVPATTRPSEPFSTRWRASSLERVEVDRAVVVNGVTIAVSTRPSTYRRILRAVARFVLVHGAWHGGWCFEPAAARARAARPRGRGAGSAVRATSASTAARLRRADRAAAGRRRRRALARRADDPAGRGARTGLPRRAAAGRDVARCARETASAGSSATSSAGRTGRIADTAAAKMYPDCTRATSRLGLRAAAPTGAGRPRCRARSDAATSWSRPCATPRSIADWQLSRRRRARRAGVELDAGHSPFFTQPGRAGRPARVARLTAHVSARGASSRLGRVRE